MEIAVSAADASDVPSLADLWKAMVEHHRRVVGNQWPVLAADVAWERRREQYTAWLTEGSGVIFIAHADGYDAPIGYLACRLLPAGPTFDLGVFHGEVDSLITAEPVRGQGVGTALLSACRDELRRRGARYWSIGVVEANRDVIELYQRLGFHPFVRTMLAALDEPSQPLGGTIA